jgi:ribonuclease P protein component
LPALLDKIVELTDLCCVLRKLWVPINHLRTRAQFQLLLARPAVARTTHFALHRLETHVPHADAIRCPEFPLTQSGAAWLGAMAPKRWARRAVTRNTIRRQIYAVGAGLMPPLVEGAHLVRLRAAFSPRQFHSASSDALRQAVRAELGLLFRKAQA